MCICSDDADLIRSLEKIPFWEPCWDRKENEIVYGSMTQVESDNFETAGNNTGCIQYYMHEMEEEENITVSYI